jgi:UDP-2-acetamido-2,6-beta-L-arabino-hexul-4-ose reductase
MINMRIVITGSEGFIARNLRVRLRELGYHDVVCVARNTSRAELGQALADADIVFHLAGVNRPKDVAEFEMGNAELTRFICDSLCASRRSVRIAFSSSTQAELDNPYGRSKRAAEEALVEYARCSGSAVHIFRLTNVFGKWARPFYNSAVATFCHQAAHGLPFTIHDASAPLRLVHVDDVVAAFTALLEMDSAGLNFDEVTPVYETTVGEVVEALKGFAASRVSLMTDRVGTGFMRALYSTYVSYLPPQSFSYSVPKYGDARGEFVEMLKTPDCGQFSYFTAHAGVTRGDHYHHTKTEKFLVIRGEALFGFRNIDTGEKYELVVRGGDARIVETIPGWAHNITNIGKDELVVMLWANEVFDRARPDTVAMRVAE